MILKNVGKKVDEIPVKISYRIIELFSAGLYSSPNKAFEELVSNSYDAFANKVGVYIPPSKLEEGASIWVCDNGKSMDKEELKDLWMIGESKKRQDEKEGERLQIGRFGIGKLSTYILTHQLTYICKSRDGFYGVTMNFKDVKQDTENLTLDEIELTENEAENILSPHLIKHGENVMPFKLFGKDSEETWTFTLLQDLKPKVGEIQEGRLKWILSTALPLNLHFELFYNGRKLKSSKERESPWKTWVFGEEDKVVEKHDAYENGTYKNEPSVNLPNLKNIRGRIDLYRDSLLKDDKSQRIGRSHGIFVHVRERLINLDDALFGMPAMTHGVFNRVRIIVHADELDDFITSTRESVKDVDARIELETYVQRKFIEVRDWYFNETKEEEKRSRATYKIAHAASSMTRQPILSAARKYYDKEISELLLTEFPRFKSKDEEKNFITNLENDLTSDEGLIKDVVWETLSHLEPLAKLELKSGIAKINLMHPFFANFADEIVSKLPFQLIALTEILTEVSLVEQSVDEHDIKQIMQRRDAILRELTLNDKPNAPLVASLLSATLSDANGLEDSVAKAFTTLGLETEVIGGNGKPDGKSVAYLDNRDSDKNYSLTYDAKSTAKERIMASTAHISGVDRHRDDYNADYAVVIARDFQGAKDPESSVNKEAKKLKVTLLKVTDFINLIFLAGPKQLGLSKLRELFESCHTVIETAQWIEDLKHLEVDRGPIREILEVISELTKNDRETPDITGIRMTLKAKYPEYDYSNSKVKELIHGISIMVPNYVTIENDKVSILNRPEIILNSINQMSKSSDIPFEFRELFLKAFSTD